MIQPGLPPAAPRRADLSSLPVPLTPKAPITRLCKRFKTKGQREKRMRMASKAKTTFLRQASSQEFIIALLIYICTLCRSTFQSQDMICTQPGWIGGEGKREAIVQRFENERTNCKISVLLSGVWTKAQWHAILLMTDGTKFTVCSGEADRKSRAMKGMRNVGNAITTRQSFRARAPAWH